jgi:hypothetical protein
VADNADLEAALQPTTAVISPRTVWKEAVKVKGATYKLFLADYTAAQPATQQPDGTFHPINSGVLAWIVLAQHEPFNAALVSSDIGPMSKPGTPLSPLRMKTQALLIE